MQVLYALLKVDPEGANVADYEGHLPIEIAADRAYDVSSAVLDLVLEMLTHPANAGIISGIEKSKRILQQVTLFFQHCTQ